MKSNKPITKEIKIINKEAGFNINGQPVDISIIEKVFDRLAVDFTIKAKPTNGQGSVITTGSVSFKKCSDDGYITNQDIVKYSFPDILKCNDNDVIIAFSKIDEILTELVNKKGI